MTEIFQIRTLEILIEQSITICLEFKALLLDEQQAYRDRDFDKINSISHNKQSLIHKLHGHNQKLLAYFKTQTKIPDVSLGTFITEQTANSKLISRWKTFNALLEECRQLNQQNRTLVTSGLTHSHHALEFLQRIFMNETTEHYSKTGLFHSTLPNRMNLKA